MIHDLRLKLSTRLTVCVFVGTHDYFYGRQSALLLTSV